MTNKIADLTISGIGYLQQVVEQNHLAVVNIHCLPRAKALNERGELLILNCVAHDEAIRNQLKRFKFYQSTLKQDCNVVIQFTAQYLETVAYYHGMAPDDPERIVQITAELMAVSEIFIEGVNKPAQKEIAKPLLAANY